MIRTNTILLAMLLINVAFVDGLAQRTPAYKDKNLPLEQRIESLLSMMTVDEKIMQLNQWTAGQNTNPNNIEESAKAIVPEIGSLILFSSDPDFRNAVQKNAMEKSRLGIPILFGYDVIHGFRTIMPIPLAQACSWDPKLVADASRVAAIEAKNAGIDWTFSPMIDIARDPRWGRVAEGYGEDPYAASVFCVSAVNGYQGNSLADPSSVAACLKHYAGYGMSEGGRDYHYTDISAQALWETYLPPYEAGVKAGAATLMSAFNDISGVPATANRYLLTEVLKQQWKHEGFVVSDWESIVQLINQGSARDRKESAYQAFNAGVEMDMIDNAYKDHLKELIAENKISSAQLDEAVRRVLRIKFRLGLFDKPYTPVVAVEKRFMQPQSIAVAEKVAAETMVLLKNKNNVLPVAGSIKKIAVIGPMAKSREHMLGSWSAAGRPEDAQSLYEGLDSEFSGKAVLQYAEGCGFDGNDSTLFDAAFNSAKAADLVVLCLGEKNGWSGENASRSTIALPIIQEQLAARIKKAGKPIVLVLTNGRPLELVRLEPLADAIVEAWQPGVAGGKPLAGILSGRINPSGKLAITFPLTTGQIPVYYNMRSPARRAPQGNYQDIPTAPLYWFGHGLSYTTFKYENLALSATKIRRTDKIRAQVEVTNNGNRDGKETVLWFISDPASTITRPMKELKFFEKKEIQGGSKVVFTFEIDPIRDLGYVNSNGVRFLEPGKFLIQVGDQKAELEVVE